MKDQLVAAVQEGGDDVLAEIVLGIRVIHILDQELAQSGPGEDVDAHGSQGAAGMCGLLLEVDDVVVVIGDHDAEAARLLHGDGHDRDGRRRAFFLVAVKHLVVVHLVNMVAGEDKEVFRIVAVDEVDVLGDRVRGSAEHF